MDAATYGIELTQADLAMKEAVECLEEGVDGTVSEHVALLCADTQIMFAEFRLQDMRRKMQNRMRRIEEEGKVA